MSSHKDGERCLFLVDGSALAYRSHFALMSARLSDGRGLDTGGIYGYTRTLLRLLRDEAPSHIAVVWDAPGPTFRHEVFPEYKATREKMPGELREQIPWMQQITEALALPLIQREGFEADDIIGTFARRAASEGWQVRIVSGDKDFMQLVDERVKLYNIMKGDGQAHVVGIDEVKEKFGVGPDRVIDVLALMGDSSDNVPGVKGVGEKTARSLVETWGGVEDILAHAEEVKGKRVRENLAKEREIALLSKRLVTIDTEVPLEEDLEDLIRREPESAPLVELCRRLGFESLASELGPARAAAPEQELEYLVLEDAAGLEEMIAELREAGRFAVDLETTSLDVLDARVVGLSFCARTGRAYYAPVNADPPLVEGSDPEAALLEHLRPLLTDPELEKGGQNIKYDFSVLLARGLEMRGIAFDTMLSSYVLDASNRAHDLDSLSLRHFDHRKIATEELIGKGKDQITMDLVPLEIVGEYACEDADYTWRLQELFEERLGEGPLRGLLDEIELPLIPVLARMEMEGVRLDVTGLEALAAEMEGELDEIEKKVHELAGREFNIASPKQLSQLLFEELELHKELGVRPKKTKTGFSTNQEVLEAMSGHPLPALILEYRSVSKLLSTYVRSLPTLVRADTGKVHSHFNQAVAATGRLSSSDPNLQNIPIRTARGRRIRSAFLPSSPDHRLISADYSQIELRILAHMTGDPQLLDSFSRGADIHRDTAARVFGLDPEAVDADMRSKAKSINFGIMYGMGAQRLARETGMEPGEAEDFIERYFASFPTVRAFLEEMKETARREGAVSTLFGRRRPIPDIDSKNGRLRAAAENMAVNTPIQGSAADLIKIAMIRIDAWIRESGLEGRMILQVHDELVFDVPEGEVETFLETAPALMSEAADLKVPLVVETGVGTSWAEAH